MKTRNIFLLALTAIFAASCHMWDEPSVKDGLESFGNKYLQESNVVTVKELKDAFKTEITGGTLKQVTKATQIKVIVTGNDEGSNIYKTLYVADKTGGISISINKGGLFSEAPVGQCMLIELEGLYIGGYGQQPQIGTLYTKDDGSTQVGRMDRYTWQEHYKLIPAIKSLSTEPIKTNDMGMLNLDDDFGKVVTLVGVMIGSVKLSGGCANREVANQSTTVYVRTSTYAEFANMVMPVTKVNITGILSRFANDVQIMPRSLKDIQPYDGLDYESTWAPTEPEGDGSATKPFNIAAAIAKCKEVGTTASSEKFYIKGYVAADATVDTKYGNITFELADSKDGGPRFTAFQMAGSDGKSLPATFKVSKGDEVVICGKVVNYNDSKPETEGKGSAIIVSVNGKDTKGTAINGGDNSGSGDNNGNSGSGDNTGGGITRSVDGETLTLTNTAVTASTNTVTVDFTALGWTHQQEEPSGSANGVSVAITKGENTTTTPKYWKTGNYDEARMYANNVFTVTGTKPIAKIVATCTSNNGTPCVGNETMTCTANGNTWTIVNTHSSNSGGVQLRMKNIVITYAQ